MPRVQSGQLPHPEGAEGVSAEGGGAQTESLTCLTPSAVVASACLCHLHRRKLCNNPPQVVTWSYDCIMPIPKINIP